MTLPKLFATAAASAVLCTTTALAQQDQQQTQAQEQQAQNQRQGQQQQQEVAQQCMDDLQALSQRMNEEGYWLTGWGGRWGARPGARPFPGTPVPGATDTTEQAQMPDATTPRYGVEPWGWRAPSFQIRTLFTSAHVLALRGDQEGCNAVLSELNQLYDSYVEQLQQAGVEPGEVANWRQEMMVAAKPVTELDPATINFGDVTGTDIRNVEDERLGTVDDVLLGEDGRILYVVVSRGGFLGIGEEHTLVPWEALKATPGFTTFLLDIPEEAMEQAPDVDPDSFGDPDALARQRQQVDQHWQEHMGG